jgi:hypothetical protein
MLKIIINIKNQEIKKLNKIILDFLILLWKLMVKIGWDNTA